MANRAGKNEKQRRLPGRSDLVLMLIFLAGLAILLYPTISMRWNAYRESMLVTSYQDQVTDASRQEEFDRMIKDAQDYNLGLYVPAVPDAFSVRDGVEDPVYESLLNLNGDGMIGYVEVPCIDVQLPLYHYTTEKVLLTGAGHLLGSALPVGGENTHSVVSAHRGLPSAEMFTHLDKVEIGDHFYYHVLNRVFAYEVDQILVVEPDEVESLSPTPEMDYSTLVTCTPYGINTQRLLVRGHRIPYSEATYAADAAENKDRINIWAVLLCILIGFLLSLVIVRLYLRHKDRQYRPLKVRLKTEGLPEESTNEEARNESRREEDPEEEGTAEGPKGEGPDEEGPEE